MDDLSQAYESPGTVASGLRSTMAGSNNLTGEQPPPLEESYLPPSAMQSRGDTVSKSGCDQTNRSGFLEWTEREINQVEYCLKRASERHSHWDKGEGRHHRDARENVAIYDKERKWLEKRLGDLSLGRERARDPQTDLEGMDIYKEYKMEISRTNQLVNLMKADSEKRSNIRDGNWRVRD
ncbi:uncharacterized protein L203_105909 [Cryptococcus depauperatus CBS 7841]|uniref:Uncharacterized protein n=1 Tax=Cryptococcus depauperatus CBS 7841 TaxID=1295531 RepID=A0AAJ8JY75_9TREE